jgi:hypothetical protein
VASKSCSILVALAVSLCVVPRPLRAQTVAGDWSRLQALSMGDDLHVVGGGVEYDHVSFVSADGSGLTFRDKKRAATGPTVLGRAEVSLVDVYRRTSPGIGFACMVLGGLAAVELPLAKNSGTSGTFAYGMAGVGATGAIIGFHLARAHRVLIYRDKHDQR